MDKSSQAYRSGFVAVAGRPNVGKSTLVNRIAGRELSIVTPKAQTTRHRISAIVTLAGGQMILQDTPGIHEPMNALNRVLVATAVKTLQDSDVILHLVEPGSEIPADDHRIIDLLRRTGRPAVLALNKVDTLDSEKTHEILKCYTSEHEYRHTFAISALTGQGVEELTDTLLSMLPLGPPLYPEDDISDLPVRFFVAEIVREQITMMTTQEVPYKTTVVVESFKQEPHRVVIAADIHTERQSHKKILVGKGGKMIKKIGEAARKKAEHFLGMPVRLELFVKVTPHWTRDPKMVEELLDCSPGSS